MLQTCQKVFRIVTKCHKMFQNVPFRRIVVRMDLFEVERKVQKIDRLPLKAQFVEIFFLDILTRASAAYFSPLLLSSQFTATSMI